MYTITQHQRTLVKHFVFYGSVPNQRLPRKQKQGKLDSMCGKVYTATVYVCMATQAILGRVQLSPNQ